MSVKLSLRQNIIWNSSGSLIYLALQWLVAYLVVILLGFHDAGIFSLAMSISTVAFAIALYGVRGYQVSDVSGKYEDKTYILTRSVTTLLSVAGTFIFLIAMGYDLYTTLCIAAFLLFKISESYVDVYHGIIQRSMRMDYIGKSFIVRGVVSNALFILCAVATKDLLLSLLIQALSSFILIFLYDRPRALLFSKKHSLFSTKKIVGLLIECFPLAIFALLSNLLMSLPRVSLEDMKGSEVLGIYASVAIPAAIIPVVAGFIFSPVLTLFAEHVNARNFALFNGLLRRTLTYIVLFSLAGIAVGAFAGDLALRILFGEGIAEYTYLFPPVLCLASLTALSWYIGLMLTVLRDFKGLIIASTLAVAVCTFTVQSFISQFGANGVSFVLIVALILQIVIMSVSMKYRLHKIKS